MAIVLDASREVAKNLLIGVPALRNLRLRKPRALAQTALSDHDIERYALLPLRILSEVLPNIRGLHVLEIGPGDYLTSGFTLLAAGAASYTSIERFPGDYSGPDAKKWYQTVQDAWPRLLPELPWPDYLSAANFPEGYKDRVKSLQVAIEDAHLTEKFDVIGSFQVGEHISDLTVFAETSARLLKPGGVVVHRIDFGPHDCWRRYDDPLTFLRFPDWLWSLMGSNRGTPNRFRFHEFYKAFEKAGLQVEVTAKKHFAMEKIDKKRLQARFRKMPADSLAIMDAVFVCRK